MAKIKNTFYIRFEWVYERTGTLMHCWKECKMHVDFGK